MKRFVSIRCTVLLLTFALPREFVGAQPASPSPVPAIEFKQRLSARVPLDVHFRDEAGRETELGDYFRDRPVILVPVYYGCPMLCTQVLNGLVRSLKTLPLKPGHDFTILAFSINPHEGPNLAARKRESYLQQAGLPADADWHFLTGDEQAIERLSQAIGFEYQLNPATGLYAHAAGITFVTPGGVISRYLLGIDYDPRDVKLALVEASDGKIGSPADHLLLLCFQYDPASGKYGFVIMRVVRLAGLATVLGLGALVFFMSRGRRAGKRRNEVPG